jgi:hypothetical protein
MRTRMFRRLAVTVCLASLACAAAFAQGGKPLNADLDGDVEVPVIGDLDATGHATLRLNSGQGTVCYNITVQNVDPILAAHIHIGGPGVPGPIIVHLPPVGGVLSGCTIGVARDVIKDIRKNPGDYYVNVHNAPFLGGAARGQLENGF